MKQMCQSCGMPIKNDSQLALESDGSKSKYCVMCYKDGEFLQPDITADEMRKFCIDIMKKEMKMPKFISKCLTRNIYKLDRWK